MTDETTIHLEVQSYYANRAEQGSSCCDSSESFYDSDLTLNLPEEVANFSLGCGNPITLANLQPGETVLDLGSGGGLDCFLAAREVGETGKVIGIDMTPAMLERANAARDEMGYTQVEFRKGFIEEMPVDDSTVDVIISNCVVNLSPTKDKVFSEMHRVLKPGGRIAISDIVSQTTISEGTRTAKNSWSACAAGAIMITEWEEKLAALGFTDIQVQAKSPAGDLLPEHPQTELFSALISAVKA